MDTLTFIDPAVVEWLNENVILVKINGKPDNMKPTEFAKSWGVKGYPTFVLTDATGEEIDRGGVILDPEEFIDVFENFLVGKNTLADLEKRAGESPSGDLFYKVAEKYKWRGESKTAEGWYQRALRLDATGKDSLSRECLFALADMSRRDRDYAEANLRYQKLIDHFPDHDYGQLAYIYQALCLRDDSEIEAAIVRFQDYLKAYPEGIEVEYATKKIKQLNEALVEDREESQ